MDVDVAGGVGEVEADDATLVMRKIGDRAQIKHLSTEILHTRQQYERDAMAMPFEGIGDRRFGQYGVAVAFEFDQRIGGIESVEANLRFDRVAIRRKRAFLDQDGR